MTPDKTLKASEVPRLVVAQPDGKEVHHHIAGSEVTIGRDPSNRICLSDQFVSKFHAKLLVSAHSMRVVDLGSANKTYVNGEAITERPVRFGDSLRFAGVECRLEGPESAQPKPVAVASKAAAPSPPGTAPPPVAPAAPVAVPVPGPPARPTPAPARAAAPRSAPPKVEADPMKRLLTIGGVLILISLVLGVILRILLVPSEAPPAEASEKAERPTAAATETAPVAPESTPSSSPPPPAVDASGNRTADFYFEEALSYLDTGRLKEAQASFRKVLQLDPDHARAKTRLSLLDEEIASKADDHFDRAREAFRFLRYDEAIAEWEMFLLLADRDDTRYAEAQQGIEQAKSKQR